MAWTIEYSAKAVKELKKIDKKAASTIIDYLNDIAQQEDPRSKGKALKGDKRQFWRYRVGNYRILCSIENEELVILATHLGHRKDVYL
ncbi:type II toxin-antitoxin system RelE family toxin [Aliivibrio salmonicida]|uniref:type II toxin-antitoxin system RelE family toxin n=1 Tax=Aliivibrio salmonicida TaxID=40269 RepID=UPI00406D2BAA